MTYRPVGFGSHHWGVTNGDGGHWFVTVDEDPTTAVPCSTWSSLSTARHRATR